MGVDTGMKPYYERDGITIYCGDCLEVMPRLGVVFDAIVFVVDTLPIPFSGDNYDTG